MLHKICSQQIYKVFYFSSCGRYTYEVIVERSPSYKDASIQVEKGCTVHVEITDDRTDSKRNFDYFAKSFNASVMLKKASKYFTQYGLIPNPRLRFFKDDM